MKSWQQVVLDVAVLAAVTLLALFGTLPTEAAIAVIGSLAGARVTQRNGGNGAAKTGAVVGLVLGLVALVTFRRGGA